MHIIMLKFVFNKWMKMLCIFTLVFCHINDMSSSMHHRRSSMQSNGVYSECKKNVVDDTFSVLPSQTSKKFYVLANGETLKSLLRDISLMPANLFAGTVTEQRNINFREFYFPLPYYFFTHQGIRLIQSIDPGSYSGNSSSFPLKM